MSLLNNNNKKKGQKKNPQTRSNSLIPGAKGKANTKAVSKTTKLTGGGGSQRGS